MRNEPLGVPSIETLPFLSRESGFITYDPTNQQVATWLKENWTFGYNPLAVSEANRTRQLQLIHPDGHTYNYYEPGHSFEHYRKNATGKEPHFLGHITQVGWVELAIRKNSGLIGSEDKGIWTAAWDPQRWFPGSFPKDFDFINPPDRFIELVFDAEKLRQQGLVGSKVEPMEYYKFNTRIPMTALVDTSLMYINQVLGLTVLN